MANGRRNGQRGSTILEFTLVGIPLIFALISIFEIARGMWLYHTLEYAVTEGTRYATVHGVDCTLPGNTCSVAIKDIAGVIQYAGAGLLPDQLTLTFTPNRINAAITCTLQNCLKNATAWPPANDNLAGMDVTISGTYPFASAIAMFWRGSGAAAVFPTFNLPATSKERIQF